MTVLLVEDDRSVSRVVSAALRARGYDVVAVPTGAEALARAEREPPDFVVLDLGLPDIDGVEVCRRLRQWSRVPVIVLTADGAEDRKVLALDEGADDYVTKPFSMPELLARLRVAERHRQAMGTVVDEAVLTVGDLTIDVARHEVQVAGASVDLTPKEFELLVLLARHAGSVITHRVLLGQVWGPDSVAETQYLRVYARALRKKLGDDERHEAGDGAGRRLPPRRPRRRMSRRYAAFSRMCTPQAEPRPMTCASPTRAPSICRLPASPRRWWQTSQMLAMPVAAIGWPLDSSPPDTLTGVLPSRHDAPDSKKSTAPPSGHSIRLS